MGPSAGSAEEARWASWSWPRTGHARRLARSSRGRRACARPSASAWRRTSRSPSPGGPAHADLQRRLLADLRRQAPRLDGPGLLGVLGVGVAGHRRVVRARAARARPRSSRTSGCSWTGNGYLEETFFTFSFSPIRDEIGRRRRPVPPGDRDDRQDAERAPHARACATSRGRTGKALTVRAALRCALDRMGGDELDLPFVLVYETASWPTATLAGQRRRRRRCGRRARCAGRARARPGLAAGRGDPDARAGARVDFRPDSARVRRRVAGALSRAPLGRGACCPSRRPAHRRRWRCDRGGQRAAADQRGLPQLLRPAGGGRDDRRRAARRPTRTRRSASRRWRSSIAPRPRSSATSATSSERR